MKYATEQRIRFIDVMLVTYGSVKPRVLKEYFGISGSQGTKDLAHYRQLYPGNITYDTQSKSFVKTPEFERAYD